MRRSTAFRLLDRTHARVLQLADGGMQNAEIAARLAVDPTAVGPLLQVARAKLAALEELDDPASTVDAPARTDVNQSPKETR